MRQAMTVGFAGAGSSWAFWCHVEGGDLRSKIFMQQLIAAED
jgi:hypothetical protein